MIIRVVIIIIIMIIGGFLYTNQEQQYTETPKQYKTIEPRVYPCDFVGPLRPVDKYNCEAENNG